MNRNAALLLAVFCLLATSSPHAAQEEGPPSQLYGVWSEDCRSNKPHTIITPDYYAITNNTYPNSKALGLGKIDRFERNGADNRLIFSSFFLNQIGASQPTYRLANDNEIIEIRDGEVWKVSNNIFRNDPESRPPGYVALDKHKYGMKYHRCADKQSAEIRMKQIVAQNEQWLLPAK